MAVVILVLVVLMYIIILLGLTIWFEKYHFYRNNYFKQVSKTKQIDLGLSRPTSDPQTIVNPEHNHRRRVKRGVQGRRNKQK
jgi:hypothetical protein